MAECLRTNTSSGRARTQLSDSIQELLAQVRVLPRRMLLETPCVAATVPLLRGVWGAALHDLAPDVYCRVFAPNEKPGSEMNRRGTGITNVPHGQSTLLPGYVLRPAPPDPAFAPAVDWLLFGDAIGDSFTLCRAWDVASGMGLGPDRRRFHIRKMWVLMPDGSLTENAPEWSLDKAALRVTAVEPDAIQQQRPGPMQYEMIRGSEAAERPCRLVFHAPLRLIHRSCLVRRPSWTDIVVAACRRIRAWLPDSARFTWDELQREAIAQSRLLRQTPFQGERLDLCRYSGRQRAEVKMHGVSGTLTLPDGPGSLWLLLAAAQWLHIGKGTVMGLGQVEIDSL